MRTRYLINPRFQYRIIGYSAVGAALVIGALYLSNLYFFHRFTGIGKELGIPANHVYFEFLEQQKNAMLWVFLTVSTVISVILAFGGVLISHRIAGPIYHLCKELRAVASGAPLKEVRFRTNDFFPELAESYNEAVRHVTEQGVEKREDRAA